MISYILWKTLLYLSIPIASAQEAISLSTYSWLLQNLPLNISIPGKFPSYAHLDLAANNVVDQLDYGLNDFNLRWIWMNNWTYSTVLTGLNDSDQTFLLFQGLDTFTTITLCDQFVASTDNQFRQYYFDVSDLLKNCTATPALSINFGSAPLIAEAIANEPDQETWPYGTEIVYEIPNRQFIRKEQNDFGWDWGPAYAPCGPWLPGYIIQQQQNELYVRNTLIDVYKQGQRNNMIPDQNQPWVVNSSIDFIGSLPAGASLEFTLQDTSNCTVMSGQLEETNQTSTAISALTTIPNNSVDLWWPSGMGPQTLYYITLNIKNSANQTLATSTKRIGFRTIVLNELPVSEDQIAKGIAPGNNWHFEINGYPFFAKGSNFIPPDIFWPRVNESTIRTLFNAVVTGNQNMLRVWSSGAYGPDFLYDVADELGILLWSEFEFGDALYPANRAFLDNVLEEAVYQVRRINHHPSLAFWAGGNELENLELPTAYEADPEGFPQLLAQYEELFLTTLFPAVFENSRSISYAPSSTSNGFISMNFTDAPYFQERYDNVSGGIYGERDYYNYNPLVAFDFSSYPIGRFTNEFGYQSMPSVQTWRDYIPDDQLEFNSTYVLLRNRHYPPGGLNTSNFYNSSLGMGQMTLAVEIWYPAPYKTDSVANFSAWCWTTQVFQAEYYGSQIQFYRRGSGLPQRTLGSLYWQLESQWAAPTWSGIEVTGRWKVLHYRAKDLYSNVIISPFYNETTKGLEVWVTSDLWSSVQGTFDLTWYFYNGSQIPGVQSMNGQSVTVGALNSTRVYSANLSQELAPMDFANAVLRLDVSASGNLPNNNETVTFSHTNWFHASPFSLANLVDPGLTVVVSAGNHTITVTATEGISAWTWVDYPAGAVVYFSDNGFWLGQGESKTLTYNVSSDSTNGQWVNGVTVQSLWNNTLSE